jgi:hypothetical protein
MLCRERDTRVDPWFGRWDAVWTLYTMSAGCRGWGRAGAWHYADRLSDGERGVNLTPWILRGLLCWSGA